MADLVMGTMGSLIPKLYELLKEEYSLQTHVKDRIRSFSVELEHAQAALHKVAQVPWDQLDEQVQLWAHEVREASYDMEDVLDVFLVRVQQGPADSAEQQEKSLLKPLKKMTNLLKTSKARRKVSGDVKDIMTHLQEVAQRCRRYKVDDIMARPATASTIDPRLHAMYNKVKNLVGIDKSSGELISMLQSPQQDDASDRELKIVSVVGVGGLGKTTLAKAVYDKLKGNFDCGAFVPVGRNPDMKKIFKDILLDLDKQRYLKFITTVLDERQLINELFSFLHENKRYLIVIDDIWEVESWETIKMAMDDDNDSGGRIIITTRKLEVATKADEVYEQQPLPYDSSRELFLTRISGHEGKYIHNHQPDEISDKYIRKCSGIPLAIITMASLLAGKQREEWPELYNTIDFGSKDNKEAENTMSILSFSYYDLPSHLRTCLLYLSAFPEDSFIPKKSLVWMWVAEGFVHEKKGTRSFEIGEGYFNDLINRSVIQADSYDDDNIITGCRVHDVVLDFIRSMSRQENFFTILDSNQGTVVQSNVRRLANHNHKRTMGQSHFEASIRFDMPKKVRSYIALSCGGIETWAPLSSFTPLRVLALENCRATDGSCIRVDQHLGRLLQLRFLSLRGTEIGRIPSGIGALRFLQTLDLLGSRISEMPSSGSFPKRLACLRITLEKVAFHGKVFSVEGMASLEELTIEVSGLWKTVGWRLVEGLGCLKELRVLDLLQFCFEKVEDHRDLTESLGHLQKLQSLTISTFESLMWRATDLVLSHHLRHLFVVDKICFSKLPPCIDASCLPNLSHLDLWLLEVDEEGLKTLGGLPELHYLRLNLQWSLPATVHNISDSSDALYFPKLRCFKLKDSIFSFLSNKDDKRVSFHIGNGVDISMPYISDDELKSDDEMQRQMSDDEELLHRPLQSSKLQQGLAAVVYNYFLAFFLHVLAFVNRWHPFPSNRTSSPGNGNGEDPDATLSVSANGAAAASPPSRFMPCLQVLHFELQYPLRIPKWVYNLGWEHLPSLREINADLDLEDGMKNIMEKALRRAAEVHPNHPTLHMNIL